MIKDIIMDFYEYINNDVLVFLFCGLIIISIITSAMNDYSMGWYNSGYCFFSVKLPVIISCILFLLPYRRRIPIGMIIAQIITELYALSYIILYNVDYPFSDETQLIVSKIYTGIIFFLIAITMADSMFHTDSHTRQPKDTKLSLYFKRRYGGYL